MKLKLRAKTFSIIMIGFLLLAACAPSQAVVPNTGANTTPVSTATSVLQTGAFTTTTDFVNALRNYGAKVQTLGQIQQPYFPVAGQIVSVDGVDVQVFEFSSATARKLASDTISQTAATIGSDVPSWVDQPNFWAQGNLIVLYVGHEPGILDTINTVLGPPLVQGTAATSNLPSNLLSNAQKQLANALNLAESQVQVLSVQQVQWPNACLGLPQSGEPCAQVVTPGYKVVVEVAGQQYEVRTNQNGSLIRWQKIGS